MLEARAVALVAVVVAASLAGCTTAPPDPAPEVAAPRFGDVVAYDVTGHYLEFARWANGVPLPGGARVTLTVAPQAGLALDGFGGRHPVARVTTMLTTGGEPVEHRTALVSLERNAVVQTSAPLAGADRVVAFDERAYPWAWGMSWLHDRALVVGSTRNEVLSGVPLAITDATVGLRVGAATTLDGRDVFPVHVTVMDEASTVTLFVDPAVPYPVRVEATLARAAVAPFVRLDDASNPVLTMTATLASYTRGDARLPPRVVDLPYLQEPTDARFSAWDGVAPPDGDGAYAPFLLADAVQWGRTTDLAFQQWLAGTDGAVVSRATYLSRPADMPGATAHVWLVQWVSRAETYYEFQVESVPVAGAPAVTRTLSSGPVTAPGGAHGWLDPAALPSELLTIDAGVTIMKRFFGADGIQIFVRSFTAPRHGYAYFVDGGFEKELGRYTVIVNAQTGFVQSAVGPVGLRVA